MITPLDPVIAQIIPLLPLRDPETMTPQSARDALRALAASRAAVPPPPVMSAEDIKVKGAAGLLAARRLPQLERQIARPWCSSMAAAGSPAISKPMTGRRACSRSRPARWWSPSIIAARPRCAFPAPSRMHSPRPRTSSPASPNSAAMRTRVGVAGDSAGGNLAAVTAIACRDAGIKLAAQLLVYPVTDVVGNFADAKENARFPSRTENAEGYFLSRAVMEWFCGHYLANPC